MCATILATKVIERLQKRPYSRKSRPGSATPPDLLAKEGCIEGICACQTDAKLLDADAKNEIHAAAIIQKITTAYESGEIGVVEFDRKMHRLAEILAATANGDHQRAQQLRERVIPEIQRCAA